MINWKSILSSFNDKPTLLEWLKMVEKALKESVLTDVLTDTKDGKTSFIFKFADGTEIRTDYVQTKGDPGATSITRVEEISDEVIGKKTATTLRIYLSDGTFDDVVVYAQNGKDVLLTTYTDMISNDRITVSFGEFTVNSNTLKLTYNDDFSIINITGSISINVSSTVNGCVGIKINLSPVVIKRDFSNNDAFIGIAHKAAYMDTITCTLTKNDGFIISNRGRYDNLTNGTVSFEINTTFFLG